MKLLLAKTQDTRHKTQEETQDTRHKTQGVPVTCDMCHAPTKSLRLLVVGDGGLEMALKALCERLRLQVFDLRDHSDLSSIDYSSFSVIFAGVQTDMPAVYQAIDILAMPSLQEGLPMTLLEAMASGVPVVATPVGQIPEIVKDGETGFLVNPRDEEGLADVLQKIIDNREEKMEVLKNITDNARKLVEENHSSHAMAAKYLETYEWLAE